MFAPSGTTGRDFSFFFFKIFHNILLGLWKMFNYAIFSMLLPVLKQWLSSVVALCAWD